MLNTYGLNKRFDIPLNFLEDDNKTCMSSLWLKLNHNFGLKKKWKYNGGDVIFSI